MNLATTNPKAQTALLNVYSRAVEIMVEISLLKGSASIGFTKINLRFWLAT